MAANITLRLDEKTLRRIRHLAVDQQTDLLYYANTDSPDSRHARARALIEPLWSEPGKAAISVQVLQELHVNLIRKGKLDPSASWRRVGDYLAWKVIDNDRALLAAAFDAP